MTYLDTLIELRAIGVTFIRTNAEDISITDAIQATAEFLEDFSANPNVCYDLDTLKVWRLDQYGFRFNVPLCQGFI